MTTGKTFLGTSARDALTGTPGDDTITLRGGTESILDYVDGDAGNDTLIIDANGGDLQLDNFVNAETKAANGAPFTFDWTKPPNGGVFGVTNVEVVVTNGKKIVGAPANQADNVFDFSKTQFKTKLTDTTFIGATVDGGGSNDRIIGTTLGDTIWGGAGNDTIEGRDGDDSIDGGADADVIDGGAGKDRINGGTGNDVINGGNDDDTIMSRGTESAMDVVDGGAGTDTLVIDGKDGLALHNFISSTTNLKLSAAGNIFGMSGIETVVTNGNWIVGAGGNQGTNVFDFSGTTFRETASGPQTGGRIDAGGSNDVVTGSGGSDTILGGDGHDTLTGGAGNDSIDGGSGVDTAFFDTTSFNTVGDFSKWSQSIALTNGTLGTDSFTNVETIALHDIRLEWQNGEWRFFDKAGAIVSGKTVTMTQAGTQSMGFGDDTVNGTGVGDTINLNAGDDRASAGGGDDTVWGRGGNDTIDGGWGRDKLYGGADNDDLRGGTEGDLLDGGAGNDRLDGGADTDTISGGAGNDTIVSRGGESVIDIMKGGDGEDTLVIDGNDLALHNFVNSDVDLNIGSKDAWGRTLFGVSGVEIVVTNGKMIVGAGANQGNNVFDFSQTTFKASAAGPNIGASVDAGGSDDRVTGTKLGDSIWGGGGHDTLNGDDGDDKLYGGDNNDVLSGGNGNDLLVGGNGHDRLDGGADIDTARWTAGKVELNLSGTTRNGVASFTAKSAIEGVDTIVMAGGQSTIEKFEATGALDTVYLSKGFAAVGSADGEGFTQYSSGGTSYWLKGFEAIITIG